MSLPKDAFMLLSVVNTKLRDCYKNLDELCEDMNESRAEIEKILGDAGFEYNEELNKFY